MWDYCTLGKYNPSLKLVIDIAKVFNTTVENLSEFIEEG